jgi:uncharacterized protein (TIGR00730 family)
MSGTRWITVFGSARPKEGDPAYDEAVSVGRLIARHGFGLCNGGYFGTMEASGKGAIEEDASAKIRGITLADFGQGNALLTEKVEAASLFDRIDLLMKDAAAFVILPGGTGTLLELAAVLEWSNKAFNRSQPPIFLLRDFWERVIQTVLPELQENQRSPLAGRPVGKGSEPIQLCPDLNALEAALVSLAKDS